MRTVKARVGWEKGTMHALDVEYAATNFLRMKNKNARREPPVEAVGAGGVGESRLESTLGSTVLRFCRRRALPRAQDGRFRLTVTLGVWSRR